MANRAGARMGIDLGELFLCIKVREPEKPPPGRRPAALPPTVRAPVISVPRTTVKPRHRVPKPEPAC